MYNGGKFGGNKEMKQLKEKYLNYIKIYTSKENYRYVNSHLNIIVNFFLNKDVNFDTLCEFVLLQQNNNVSNTTINKRIRCLKQMYAFAKIENKDLMEFKKLKEVKKTFECLNDYQIQQLIDYIDMSKMSMQNKLILSLFLETGCRLTELLNIKVYNIDLSMNYILLEKTKTAVERRVMFTEKTKQKYLIPYLKQIKKEMLFTIKKRGVEALFERTRKQLKFNKFHPHMLRHTYASILINNDTNLEFVRLTMGHTNLTTTQRYLHYNLNKMCNVYKNQFHL